LLLFHSRDILNQWSQAIHRWDSHQWGLIINHPCKQVINCDIQYVINLLWTLTLCTHVHELNAFSFIVQYAPPTTYANPAIPPGLEYLTMIDQLLVKQKVELLEGILDFGYLDLLLKINIVDF